MVNLSTFVHVRQCGIHSVALLRSGRGRLPFPAERRFVFTVIDDTDDARVDNIAPVYELLAELGMRTTKTLWPLPCPEGSKLYFAGTTAADDAYRTFCHNLKALGFELTWHCATMESSTRQRTLQGMEVFRAEFGEYPRVHTNHGQNRENIYWGRGRYRSCVRHISALAPLGNWGSFSGEDRSSPYFWGDICRERFRYVRNFTFGVLDVNQVDRYMPYRVGSTPYVNYWFSTADAPDVRSFRRLVHPSAIERLCDRGGVCILSTHFGKGYVSEGRVDSTVETTLRFIASLPGWFVPASEALDFLLELRRGPTLTTGQLLRLETRHVLDRMAAKWL